jgi:hypothetical protein
MKAPARLFANPRQAAFAARLFACAGAGLLTAACSGGLLSDTRLDPRSPIAPDVTRISHVKTQFPKFSEIPPVPKDVRPAKAFGVAAAETVRVRDDIVRKTEPDTWTLKGGEATNAFANQGRTAAGPETTATDPAVTEAFARELRKRATPPPPPKR